MLSATPLSALSGMDPFDSSTGGFAVAEPLTQQSVQAEQETLAAAQSPAELVFIDESVANYRQLLNDFAAQENRQFEVHLLNANADGIDQISKILADRRQVDNVHILSHGSNGKVQLGNTLLGIANLNGYSGQIAKWNFSLSDNADLLIYGCDLASGAEGRLLIDAIGRLSDCDVAASDDRTGNAALGGDWNLEYATGAIDTEIALSLDAQLEWKGILAIATFQEGSGGYTSAKDTYLDSANATSDFGAATDLEAQSSLQHSLIRFDDIIGANAGQIPVGSTINSATLTVEVSDPAGLANAITMHRMLTAWNESSTWDSMTAGIQTDDVEAASTADSTLSLTLTGGTKTFTGAGLAATVQAWVDGDPNHGWTLQSNASDKWVIDSADSATIATRPTLTVDFTAPKTLVVDTTADVDDGDTSSIAALLADRGADGRISFREAIRAANNTTNQVTPDEIFFNITDPLVGGAHTINLTSQLDEITESVVIDGTTDADFTSTPIIVLDGTAAGAGSKGLRLGNASDGSTIRGLVINQFGNDGIEIRSNNNVIQGNFVGTDVTGTLARGNGGAGIVLTSAAAGNQIGGTGTGEGNLISGNDKQGILLSGSGTSNNLLYGNVIGSDAAGTAALGNTQEGILIESGATDNTIGGIAGGQANTIAFNSSGVVVKNGGTDGNAIRGNSIHSNTGLGIDLRGDGISGNDAGDGDNDANEEQNFPVLTSASVFGTELTVTGTLNSIAASTFSLDFYVSGMADGSGNGEAERFLGSVAVTTDGSGNAAINQTLNGVTVSGGEFVTATATDTAGNTSEFSANIAATVTNHSPIANAGGPYTINEGNSVTLDATGSSDADGDPLSYAWDLDNDGLYGEAGEPTTASAIVSWVTLNSFAIVDDGTYTVGVRIDDGITTPVTETANLTVNNVGPTITSANSASITENTTSVLTVTATDPVDSVIYSLSGGADQAEFAIDASTGALSFTSAPDFESPTDSDANNVYDVQVTASDGDGGTAVQAISVTVTDVNDLPVFTSSASATVTENDSGVFMTFTTVDDETPANMMSYSIVGGTDAARFFINGGDKLKLVAAADYETPLDDDGDNIYEVIIEAADSSGGTATQTVSVQVLDVNEYAIGPLSDSDGSVNSANENAPAGASTGVVAVATDADLSDTVTYSLDDDAGGRFSIDPNTGSVAVADGTLLDRSVAASHDITVRATSSDGTFSTGIFTITVESVDNFDVGPITDTDGATEQVNENSPAGTAVGITAYAVDADTTNNTVSYSLDDDAGGRFTIDTNSGIVTVANGTLVDRESAASHGITIRATSSDGSFSTKTITISIEDVDEFDIGTISDADATSNSVVENAANGTTVGITGVAADADATNSTVTYSLDDDAGGRFAIDANGGIVTVADGALLDRESAPSHGITIRATSSDGSFSTQSFTLNVEDLDEFDVSAISDDNATIDSVAENAANGTTVGIVAAAADADATNNTVTYSLDNDAGGRFAIDAISGEVMVANATLLDREASTTYTITVRASGSDGSNSTENFAVNVVDVNEFDVGPITDSNGAANLVTENAAPGTAVGITASAVDGDATNNAIAYSLDDDEDGRFAINNATGEVTIADGSLLDFETASSHILTVRATGSDGSFSIQTFTVVVANQNDNSPVITAGQLFGISETTANGTPIGIVTASDPDGATSFTGWSLAAGNDAGIFSLDAATGLLTVVDNSNLDYETTTTYTLTLVVSDGTNTSSAETVRIDLLPENDNVPIFLNPGTSAVLENTSTVLSLAAIDHDLPSQPVAFSIIGGPDQALFRISSSNELAFAVSPDFESPLDADADNVYHVDVQASDGNGGLTIQSIAVTVLDDRNEFPISGITDSDPTTNSVAENSTAGTAVGIRTLAIDSDPTAGVSYSLDQSAGGRFAIDATTGQIVTTGAALDFESNASHIVTVRATSTDGSFSTASYTVAIEDVNEAPTGVKLSNNTLIGGTDTTGGLVVGILHADDPDTVDTFSYTIAGGADADRFLLPPSGAAKLTIDDGVLVRSRQGKYVVDVQVVDAAGNTYVETLTVTVHGGFTPPPPIPDPPAASPPTMEEPPEAAETTESETAEEARAQIGSAAVQEASLERTIREAKAAQQANATETGSLASHSAEISASLQVASVSEDRHESRSRDGLERNRAVNSTESVAARGSELTRSQSLRETLAVMSKEGALWQELDDLQDKIDSRLTSNVLLVGSAGAAATGMTVGYVVWTIRSGFLLTGLIAQMPAWRVMDPLVVMQGTGTEEGEGGSLQEIMDQQASEFSAHPKEEEDGGGS